MSTATQPEAHTAPAPARGNPRPCISARNRAAIQLLDSWMNVSEEAAAEQRETFEYLKIALDADRPGYRKLFPDLESRGER